MSRAALIHLACLALLLFSAAKVRVDATDAVVDKSGIWLRDPDTMRRLVMMDQQTDASRPYPSADAKDGYPHGSVIHWTRPMSWAISCVDAIVAGSYPMARPNEAGALWVGVILGTLSVLAMALLAWRLFADRFAGLLVASLYAFAHPMMLTTQLGNGDHQSLQNLLCVGALLSITTVMAGRGGTAFAVLGGVCLGLANWVSTESMALLQLLAVASFGHLWLLKPEARGAACRLHLAWSLPALLVIGIADFAEHANWPSLEWDKVSSFQGWQLLVFVAFVGLLPIVQRRAAKPGYLAPLVAAGIAVVAVGVGPLAVTSLREALASELDEFTAANTWVQAQVDEYTPLFYKEGRFMPSQYAMVLGYAHILLPVWFFGWLRAKPLGAARIPLAIVALGLFLFTLAEIKFAHLFLIAGCLLLVGGGGYFVTKITPAGTNRRIAQGVLGLAALGLLFGHGLPPGQPVMSPPDTELRQAMSIVKSMTARLDPQDDKRATLALWTEGANLMYYGDAPVVGSGYHRNLDGIHDSWRALTAMSFQHAEPILRKHKVRFVFTRGQVDFLRKVEPAMPELGRFLDSVTMVPMPRGPAMPDYRWSPRTLNCLWWYFVFGPGDTPQFKVVHSSPTMIPLPGPEGMNKPPVRVPMYRVWRVVYPEEAR